MHYAIIFILLMSFIVGLGLLARRLDIPYPVLFVLGGLVIGFIPHLPELTLDPDLVFFIFLPPLLYIQAFFTSWRDFRRELRPISLLAIGLVIATTVAVAFVSHWLIPAFPLSAGFVLGAIISPPDAIAASAIAQRLGLPRRVVTIIEGESLVNDSTSLVIFKVALAAVGMGSVHIIGDVWLPGYFFFVSVGGIAVGLAVGWIINQVRHHVLEAGAEIVLSISILTPYISYIAGEMVHVSSVLAVVFHRALSQLGIAGADWRHHPAPVAGRLGNDRVRPERHHLRPHWPAVARNPRRPGATFVALSAALRGRHQRCLYRRPAGLDVPGRLSAADTEQAHSRDRG